MAKLCQKINDELASGSVNLVDLWDKLQSELGYYDTGVCCYLLGFVFKFYLGKFTWFDGSNAHKLTEDNVSTMILEMVNGKSAGMKLSSESDMEKRFKDITGKIFNLSHDEIGDINDTRKNIKIHITNKGYPLWALKYMPEDRYAGIKQDICKIIDSYVKFILEDGNENDVIENTVELVRKNAKIYINILKDALSDKDLLLNGMKNFMDIRSPKVQNVCSEYGFSMKVMFSMLEKVLAEEKWQWKEDEVATATDGLALDLTLVGIINKTLKCSSESIEKTKDILYNNLNCIRVPGCIFIEMKDALSHTVISLNNISNNRWIGYNRQEKSNIIDDLKINAQSALDNIFHPIGILKKYIKKEKLGTFSDTELAAMLQQLPKEAFAQTENNFKSNVLKEINELDYTKKVKEMAKTWTAKTNTKSLAEWGKIHLMPAQWVVPQLNVTVTTLAALEHNERIDIVRLENAYEELKSADLSALSSEEQVNQSFIRYVASDKYFDLLLPHIVNLKKAIQDNGHRNYGKWNNEIPHIRKIVEAYIENDLKKEVSDKAKLKVAKMSEKELRKKVVKMVEKSPEACLLLLND